MTLAGKQLFTEHPGVCIEQYGRSRMSRHQLHRQSCCYVQTSSSQIDLSWTGSTDNVAMAGYRVIVGGIAVATLPALPQANRIPA